MADEPVLVTGGSGYLASSVIKLLQEKGFKVRTTVRDSKNETKIKHLNELCPDAKHKVEVVEADLTNADSWHSAVAGCQYVYHVASPLPISNPKDFDEVIKPAVEGTLNVLKACAASKMVKRVVITGSFVAIADYSLPAGHTVSEKDWLNPEDSRCTPYIKSKGLAEKAAWSFVEELPDGQKFELVIVNPGLVMGPVLSYTVGSSINIMNQIMTRASPLTLQCPLAICDVRDVALAHYKCMTLPEAVGNRHMVVTSMVPMVEIAKILDKEFRPHGYNIATTAMPNFMVTLMSYFSGDLKQMKDFCKDFNLDSTRLTKVLGITPTPVDKTLIDMAYSMIEKGITPKKPQYTGPPKNDQK